ncbi:MAG: LLM class F420-dependent oxidoreductase [Kibdelosporangium sp.]
MEFGITAMNSGAAVTAESTVELSRLAEEAGYTTWWASDHVVLPTKLGPDSPMPSGDPIMDPLVHLTYVAAVTEKLKLATGIVILPQRNPLVLAKQVASLDVLSGGRLALGVGAGYLEPEMTAVGVPMATRGKRTDEYLDAMTELWTSPAPSFQGEFVSFTDIDAHPRPVRPGGPRIVIGGNSPAAYRRAVARGHVWFGIGSYDDLVGHLAGLKRAAARGDRPARLGELEVNFLPMPFLPGAGEVRRYEDLGVKQLVLYPRSVEDPGGAKEFLRRHAELI